MSIKFTGNWAPDSREWRDVCNSISNDLTSFKSNPVYIRIIANDLRDVNTTKLFFDYIKNTYPELFDKLDIFNTNDTLGKPNVFNIEGHNVCPGTLRFVKVLGDIKKYNPKSIIEIGSGYGGQCKIIKDYLNVDYTLVDLPESLLVAKSYLKHFNTDATFVSSEDITLNDQYDLVISDYCISEFDQEGMNFYIEHVVKKCNNAYFTINNDQASRDHLLTKLREIYNDVIIVPEEPRTSAHSNIVALCSNKI
jgi:hypothetical protein